MAIKTEKYRRKPLVVDAVRVTTENFDELASWCQGDIQEDTGGKYIRVRVHTPKNVRQTQAYLGDWILYTDKGYKVYSDKAFMLNFSVIVEEEESKAA